jgi:hypothetical protein
MQLTRWTCTECKKEFGVGEWTCADGVTHHIVPPREYLRDDAPSDPGHPQSGGMDSLRDGRTRVCNIPPDRQVVVNGEVHLQPGGYVEFIRGRFSTTDPEVQHHLNIKGGWCSEERWRQVWMSQAQQLRLREDELNAKERRLENERNELLSKVKDQKQPVGAR